MPEDKTVADRLFSTAASIQGTSLSRSKKTLSDYLRLVFPEIVYWANICSPNILRTVRRTMIRFLIELLVRRTWFGQFEEFTCSQLVCNEMQASAQTCGRRAADNMIENVG